MITHKRLLEVLHYDPLSGIFRWLRTMGQNKAGKVAGGNHVGYVRIQVDGYGYYAHRLAWFYVHASWPAEEIDHKNGIKNDNRLLNLESVSSKENCIRRSRGVSIFDTELALTPPPPVPLHIEQKSTALTVKRLRELWHYDPETGLFRRCKNRSNAKTNSIANYISYYGYIMIGIAVGGHKRRYYGHRLAWLYMTGKWPELNIDHKNGNRADNRWQNLREATQSQNLRNRGLDARSKSGFKGVSQRDNKWRAGIHLGYINGKPKKLCLGTFDTPEEAHAAYSEAAVKLFGEFARVA